MVERNEYDTAAAGLPIQNDGRERLIWRASLLVFWQVCSP